MAESHGPAIGAIVDGCPPGLALSEADIQADLEPRRTGTSKHTSQRQEPDQVRILSGVFEGRTTGTAIGLLVDNVDARSRDYEKIRTASVRPRRLCVPAEIRHPRLPRRRSRLGTHHGRDGRREARLRASTCASNSASRSPDTSPRSARTASDCIDAAAARTNPFFCAEPDKLPLLEDYLRQLRRDGDSAGARVTALRKPRAAGLGEPMFDRLDADIAFAMMGINAAKAVEIGDGVAVAGQRGSQHRDELTPGGFASTIPAGRSAASVPDRT